jgi:hypothetical protein
VSWTNRCGPCQPEKRNKRRWMGLVTKTTARATGWGVASLPSGRKQEPKYRACAQQAPGIPRPPQPHLAAGGRLSLAFRVRHMAEPPLGAEAVASPGFWPQITRTGGAAVAAVAVRLPRGIRLAHGGKDPSGGTGRCPRQRTVRTALPRCPRALRARQSRRRERPGRRQEPRSGGSPRAFRRMDGTEPRMGAGGLRGF